MKYIGGKNQLNEIAPILQNAITKGSTYVEPFCGIVSIGRNICAPRIFNDINKWVVAFWKELSEGREYPTGSIINKEDYLTVWHNRNELSDKALVGYVLLKGCFRGKFSSWGDRTKDQVSFDKEILMLQPLLKNAKWSNRDYRQMEIPPESIIYCDPPYANTCDYRNCGVPFAFDSRQFWDWASGKVLEGHKVFVSESILPPVSITKVSWSTVWQKEIKSNISNCQVKRTEYLFYGKENTL